MSTTVLILNNGTNCKNLWLQEFLSIENTSFHEENNTDT